MITMLTFETDRPKQCGIVEVDELGIVKSFHEKVEHPPGNRANGAIYVFESEFIEEIVENRTLVCLSIETGRRAQIRLQMSALGAPVSGDTMYGKGRNSAGRLCLHASSLRFIHPNGDEMQINSPLPSIFRRILKNG